MTWRIWLWVYRRRISTHILTRRMTTIWSSQALEVTHFNSHPHKEDDTDGTQSQNRTSISTHILTRRMTVIVGILSLALHFNSHPHKEDDIEQFLICGVWNISTHILTRRMTIMCGQNVEEQVYFNSHPHKEDDRNIQWWDLVKQYFNSHPHKEDDVIRFPACKCHIFISTHILTRRMTIKHPFPSLIMTHFNSHPHKEDDRRTAHDHSRSWYFNSHPHKEDDYSFWKKLGVTRISTHILTRRMTLYPGSYRYSTGISTHILTRRMTQQ